MSSARKACKDVGGGGGGTKTRPGEVGKGKKARKASGMAFSRDAAISEQQRHRSAILQVQ